MLVIKSANSTLEISNGISYTSQTHYHHYYNWPLCYYPHRHTLFKHPALILITLGTLSTPLIYWLITLSTSPPLPLHLKFARQTLTILSSHFLMFFSLFWYKWSSFILTLPFTRNCQRLLTFLMRFLFPWGTFQISTFSKTKISTFNYFPLLLEQRPNLLAWQSGPFYLHPI